MAAAVSLDNTLIIVGGYNGNYLDEMYQYNPVENDWVKLPNQLRKARSKHIALLVPESLFPECA